jgi:hypothetical protein
MALKSTDRRVDELEINKQDSLVSGENIRTINGESVLGDGDITVQQTLVSGTNIKTINGNSLLGSGDIVITPSSSITVGTTPITSGVDGRVLFQSGGVVQQDSSFTWDNVNKRFGINTTSPTQKFEIVELSVNSTPAVFKYNSDYFLSIGYNRILSRLAGTSSLKVGTTTLNDIELITNNTDRIKITSTGNVSIGATTAGARLDVRAQGALSTDIILRTRNSADTRNFLVVNGAGDVFNNGAGGVASNTFFGENSGRSATGDLNTFFGASAGRDNTTGVTNSFFGNSSGRATTTGGSNSFFGRAAGLSNTAGAANSYFGASAGQNANGTGNVFLGNASALNITVGNSNISIGNNSAISILSGANLTQSNESIFIGQGTKANANNETNQIVIGHNAIGLGSNTVVIGNTSIVTTQLRGTVRLSLQASAPTGVEGAIYYDSTTKKHYGHDGTNWNALY